MSWSTSSSSLPAGIRRSLISRHRQLERCAAVWLSRSCSGACPPSRVERCRPCGLFNLARGGDRRHGRSGGPRSRRPAACSGCVRTSGRRGSEPGCIGCRNRERQGTQQHCEPTYEGAHSTRQTRRRAGWQSRSKPGRCGSRPHSFNERLAGIRASASLPSSAGRRSSRSIQVGRGHKIKSLHTWRHARPADAEFDPPRGNRLRQHPGGRRWLGICSDRGRRVLDRSL